MPTTQPAAALLATTDEATLDAKALASYEEYLADLAEDAAAEQAEQAAADEATAYLRGILAA